MDHTYRHPDGRIWQVAVRGVRVHGLPPITLRFAEVDGRVECVALEVGANFTNPKEPDPVPITSSLLRRINLGQLVEEARGAYVKAVRDMDRAADRRLGRRLAPHLKAAEQSAGRRPGGRRELTPTELERVAEVYRDAFRVRRPPTKAVANAFHLSHTAAAKRVAKARALGLLPPTSRGRARAAPVGGRGEKGSGRASPR